MSGCWPKLIERSGPPLVPAGLDRTILPGDHYSLLRRPEVERLARELTAQLVRNNDEGSTPGDLFTLAGAMAKP